MMGGDVKTSDSGSYTFPNPYDGYIGINYYHSLDHSYAEEFTIELWPEELTKLDMNYHTSARKPFNFNGKSAVFVGDSITQGYTSGSTITQENYVKKFCNAVGLNYTNLAVGGATLQNGLSQVTSIPAQVVSIQTAPDYLFIAGGVNDWVLGGELQYLRASISNLCTYINNNFSNTKVIVITPIKEAGWYTTHLNMQNTGYLKTYCDVIYEEFKKHDNGNYSIVCGYEFGFPDEYAPTAYKEAMFGDLLHPSEKGYANLYAPGLLNALQ